MEEPIDRFCRMVSAIESQMEREEVIFQCHLCVGPKNTSSYMLSPAIQGLKTRLQEVVEFGINEEFVVDGLLHRLIKSFRNRGSGDGMLESITFHEDRIAELQGEPHAEDHIAKMRELIADWPAKREAANRLLGWLEGRAEDLFSSNYWLEWRTWRVKG